MLNNQVDFDNFETLFRIILKLEKVLQVPRVAYELWGQWQHSQPILFISPVDILLKDDICVNERSVKTVN